MYVFATEAVRSAANGQAFTERVNQLCGLDVEVLSGETEANIGLLGAIGYGDGGMIDLGGASTEITVREGGRIIYAKSVKMGAVRLYDLAGRDKDKILGAIQKPLEEFGGFNAKTRNMYGVSGTATTLAALKHGLREYNADIVQGTVLTVREIENYADVLLKKSIPEICEMLTVDSRRADIIGGGALFLSEIMKKLSIDSLTVSDSDNLEGFVLLKEGRL